MFSNILKTSRARRANAPGLFGPRAMWVRDGVPDVSAVVLAGRQSLLLAGVKRILEETGRFRVRGVAPVCEKALPLARTTHPDIVVLEAGRAGRNLSSVIRELNGLTPCPRVLVLAAEEDSALLDRVLHAGGMGCITTTRSGRRLVAALDFLAVGRMYVPCWGTRTLRRRLEDNGSRRRRNGLDRLSRSERRILPLVALGLTSREIGARVFLAPKTVENYRASIRKKLELRTRAEIVGFALEAGVLRGDGKELQ
ncbi:MAG: response regulator transcription factor [Gemmatimonadetes bacterium]|nr:response regulator transcription factor [Gemmatimonadota bacterium]